MRREIIYNGDEIISDTMRDMTWVEIRAMRNQALVDTDWMAVSDRTLSQPMSEYRRALRDLPQDYDSANEAADNFPVMPSD